MASEIFLLLGTNLGDKKRNLEAAIQKIEQHAGKIIRKSSIYKTKAWGRSDQPDFYNQVIALESALNAEKLLATVLNIEKLMGRNRTEKWSERIIDIDILFYGDVVLESKTLQLPHPEMIRRRFTLIPLAEIAPDLIHPVYKMTITELLKNCKDELAVEILT